MTHDVDEFGPPSRAQLAAFKAVVRHLASDMEPGEGFMALVWTHGPCPLPSVGAGGPCWDLRTIARRLLAVGILRQQGVVEVQVEERARRFIPPVQLVIVIGWDAKRWPWILVPAEVPTDEVGALLCEVAELLELAATDQPLNVSQDEALTMWAPA